MPHSRERDIVASFIGFADSLVEDYDVLDLVTRLTEDCARLLDITAAGLLLADARGVLHLFAATSEEAHELEIFQLQREEGPCLDCYRGGGAISVADLAAESARWPRFVAAATESGFASVHAIPLRLRDEVLGTLGLFGAAPGALNPEDLNLAQALAHVATIAILRHDTAVSSAVTPRLQAAVNSRGVLDMAKGVLAQVHGLSMATAFERLRDYARRHDQHLSEVASIVVSGDPDIRGSVLADLGSEMTRHRSTPTS
ncbi:transcriptional regulator [Mycobacterium antarcticum]|uniref:GAF and ANTAR domain-containing protein n=1 Tax=Mycolicibacterium sp. TUM20983 TaxID=3023369 RepID=UPI00238A024D|nr:GAF and ANTAR domain-containing protein [Mycolicibacterium sp. TUM20983]GLP78107.1 transcriptional regulator [Mycolicibacterium sp. TUM20983]